LRRISLQQTVEKGIAEGAKSVFLFPGLPPLGNTGRLSRLEEYTLEEKDIEDVFRTTASNWQIDRFQKQREIDYSYGIEKVGRFRVCAFSNMGQLALVMRLIPPEVPRFETLNLPDVLKEFTRLRDGLVLVTGPAGNGKSTTLASLLDIINRDRSCHIVTIEDPIEYIFRSKESIVSQREVGRDTLSFGEALKRTLREDPDVVMVGEVRDLESLNVVLEMAETGHLVLCSMHTQNVVQTLERIYDLFPEDQRNQVKTQVAQVLRGVISLRLLARKDGRGFVPVCEVMKVNSAIRNLIRADKSHEIYTIIESSGRQGMVTMDRALLELYRSELIDIQQVISHSSQDKRFLEEVTKQAPKAQEVFTGGGFLDLQHESVLYSSEYDGADLRYFDASGTLIDSPLGLMFKDEGQKTKDEAHYLADYTILNGKKPSFNLPTLFSASYKVLATSSEKGWYDFKLRIIGSSKDVIETPKAPVSLIADGNWHTITLPIPKMYQGRAVRCFMMLFDHDVREVVFNSIRFA
jgi:twitching motility protein PilT